MLSQLLNIKEPAFIGVNSYYKRIASKIKVVYMIKQRPGIKKSELLRKTGIWYHFFTNYEQFLYKNKYIRVYSDGWIKRYFPNYNIYIEDTFPDIEVSKDHFRTYKEYYVLYHYNLGNARLYKYIDKRSGNPICIAYEKETEDVLEYALSYDGFKIYVIVKKEKLGQGDFSISLY